MKTYRVTFRPHAEADLSRLYRYILDESGRGVADAYLDRIEAACMALQTFPHRGVQRDDLSSGLRVVGFERRAAIAFLIRDDAVVIVRILYGGQDLERWLSRIGDGDPA